MANVKIAKVVSALPGTLVADTIYAVRTGAGYDLYVTDNTGSTAHALNVPATLATLTGTQTLTNKTLTAAILTIAINAQTGTAYTLVLTDQHKKVTRSNAAANTTTIPANASVAFPVGTVLGVTRLGAGVSSIVAAAGVTLNGVVAGSGAIQAVYTGVTLTKIATNTWIAEGNIGTVA